MRTRALFAGTLLGAACASHAPPAPAPAPAAPASAAAGTVYVSALDLSPTQQGWGRPHADSSVAGNPLRIGGRTYARGVGTHAASILRIRIDGARRFLADAGVDDEAVSADGARRGSVVFQVYVDGREVWHSAVLRGGEPAVSVDVPLRGARELWLITDATPDGNGYDHADWADARILLDPGAPVPRTYLPAPGPAVVLTPPAPAAPRINGPARIGAHPGHPFLYRVPVTGEPPLRYAVSGLPSGLRLDDATGIITGTTPARGHYTLRITATNARGSDARDLTLVAGDTLALTPPMGWNSWNVWGCHVDEAKIRAAADAMVSSGLAAHGWRFINIDDCWMRDAGPGARAADGTILTAPTFPDMKALADYVHSKGLKLGIYIGPNQHTCQHKEASAGHVRQDFTTFARWGIDYVKYDWCDSSRDSVPEKYRHGGEVLRDLDRDIVYSLCEYGWQDVWTWGADAGGNLWRTTGDITDTWGSLASIGFHQDSMAPYAGPGHWNDPDMLVVGRLGWGPNPRPTRLTPDEQYTHITLWSMLAAPLLIGADLPALDDFTKGLLTNDEVLAIDQDPLGVEATQTVKLDGGLVYTRPLADGSTAIAVFNTDWSGHDLDVAWSALGLARPVRLRDVWRQRDVPVADTVGGAVPSHGVRLYRAWP